MRSLRGRCGCFRKIVNKPHDHFGHGAARAYAVGLANRVVAPGGEVAAAVAMAEKIVDQAPLALAAMKRFVNDGGVAEGSGGAGGAVRDSEDAKEGVAAFRKKRRPRYRGR